MVRPPRRTTSPSSSMTGAIAPLLRSRRRCARRPGSTRSMQRWAGPGRAVSRSKRPPSPATRMPLGLAVGAEEGGPRVPDQRLHRAPLLGGEAGRARRVEQRAAPSGPRFWYTRPETLTSRSGGKSARKPLGAGQRVARRAGLDGLHHQRARRARPPGSRPRRRSAPRRASRRRGSRNTSARPPARPRGAAAARPCALRLVARRA